MPDKIIIQSRTKNGLYQPNSEANPLFVQIIGGTNSSEISPEKIAEIEKNIEAKIAEKIGENITKTVTAEIAKIPKNPASVTIDTDEMKRNITAEILRNIKIPEAVKIDEVALARSIDTKIAEKLEEKFQEEKTKISEDFADKNHTHTSANITDFEEKTTEILKQKITAGENISLKKSGENIEISASVSVSGVAENAENSKKLGGVLPENFLQKSEILGENNKILDDKISENFVKKSEILENGKMKKTLLGEDFETNLEKNLEKTFAKKSEILEKFAENGKLKSENLPENFEKTFAKKSEILNEEAIKNIAVKTAENAEKLGGELPETFAKKSEIFTENKIKESILPENVTLDSDILEGGKIKAEKLPNSLVTAENLETEVSKKFMKTEDFVEGGKIKMEKLPEIPGAAATISAEKIQEITTNIEKTVDAKMFAKRKSREYSIKIGSLNTAADRTSLTRIGYFYQNNSEIIGKIITKIGFVVAWLGTMHIVKFNRDGQILKQQEITFNATGEQWFDVDLGREPFGADEFIGFCKKNVSTGTFKYSQSGGSGFGLLSVEGDAQTGTVGSISGNGDLNVQFAYAVLLADLPILKNEYWKYLNLSITGDSISTLEGKITAGNAIFYTSGRKRQFGIAEVSDTWWGQLAAKTGAEILSNDAWSGSMVSGTQAGGLANSRTIGKIDKNTDILIIMIGINDYANNKELWSFDPANIRTDSVATFSDAYCKMLADFQKELPETRIICVTPLKIFSLSGTPTERKNRANEPLVNWAKRIEEICEAFGVECVNSAGVGFHRHNAAEYLPDGTHPNKAGATKFAEFLYREIGG